MSRRHDLAREAERFFEERFAAGADAESAKAQQAYMKTTLLFHGVDSKTIRSAAADFTKAHRGELDGEALRAIAMRLFEGKYFDVRSAAIVVLDRAGKDLREDDLEWLLAMVRRGACWAHVDYLATKPIGAIVGDPPRARSKIRAWARDDDVWVRRTALLCQLDALRGGAGDFDLWSEIAAPMIGQKEFWIRKALGWVLREVSKKRPELTAGFLREHGAECSGLTFREGSKYLPAAHLRGLPAR